MDSFFFPGLYHISALQKEGLMIWNAANEELVRTHLMYWLTIADTLGAAPLNGTVGHRGACPCRIFCGTVGRHNAGCPQYYMALLKPDHFAVPGSDFPDINPGDIKGASTQDYAEKVKYVLESQNNVDFEKHRRETGIVKPSYSLAFNREDSPRSSRHLLGTPCTALL
jgi:hypothetical protein